MIDFRDFTGYALVYKTITRYPEYKEENWVETANRYIEIYNKAQNAIHKYHAHNVIIYYVVDGIAEQVIDKYLNNQ